ncbi:ALA-interacting subunit 3 [Glycine soja]
MSVEPPSNSVAVAEGRSKNAMKPKYSRFSQQELHAWQPILTPSWAISIFTVIELIFILVGLASCLHQGVVEVPFRYDDECLPPDHKNDAVAYIKDFGYVKSRDDRQLRSKASENDVGTCSPEDYTPNDMGHKPIVPCGLIAWSLFNDTYKLSSNNKDLMINKKNIAWTSDQKGNLGPKNFQAGGLIGGARLNQSLPIETGNIEVNDEVMLVIENNYNTYEFGGRKSFVLSTTTRVDGRNHFLGMTYILVGGISLLFAAAFLLLYVMQTR